MANVPNYRSGKCCLHCLYCRHLHTGKLTDPIIKCNKHEIEVDMTGLCDDFEFNHDLWGGGE